MSDPGRHRAPRRGLLRRSPRRRGPWRRGPWRGPVTAALAAGVAVLTLASGSPAAAGEYAPAVVRGLATVRTSAASSAPTAVPARAVRPTAAGRRPVVVTECARHRVVAPRMLVISCADADDYLTRLTWVSWRSMAVGRGVQHLNDCQPSCAAGHVRGYPVLVALWRPERRPHRPGRRFTRLTAIYTGRRPLEYTAAGRSYRAPSVTWRL